MTPCYDRSPLVVFRASVVQVIFTFVTAFDIVVVHLRILAVIIVLDLIIVSLLLAALTFLVLVGVVHLTILRVTVGVDIIFLNLLAFLSLLAAHTSLVLVLALVIFLIVTALSVIEIQLPRISLLQLTALTAARGILGRHAPDIVIVLVENLSGAFRAAPAPVLAVVEGLPASTQRADPAVVFVGHIV
jgi:hypothetical protein